jgi:hypothetical protein
MTLAAVRQRSSSTTVDGQRADSTERRSMERPGGSRQRVCLSARDASLIVTFARLSSQQLGAESSGLGGSDARVYWVNLSILKQRGRGLIGVLTPPESHRGSR